MTAREMLNESMSLLAENQRRLREAMDRDSTTAKHEDGYNERHSAQAQRLARSAAALGAELRKHGDVIEEEAKQKTPEERAEIATRWLMKLPRDLLRPIVERLAAVAKGA